VTLSGNLTALCAGATALLCLALSFPVHAQSTPSRAWLDPALLAAAKAEGSLVVYTSTNEREGLAWFKLFEEATGIKVEYVRASDSVLMGRIAIEFRANQHSYDVVHTTTVNKIPPQLLAQFDPPEAKNISANARDPDRRWYGVYANYNAPAYNTNHVKASELPKSYEEIAARKEWAGKVAIDGTDNEWLKGMILHYGEQRAVALIKDMVAALKPVVTDGHLALARSVGAGEYWIAVKNYVNLTMNVKLSGAPTEFWALDPVVLMFGQVGISMRAPHPNAARLAANFMLSQESQQLLAKFGRLPTRKDVQGHPPGVIETLEKRKVITVLLSPDEEKKWQRQFEQLFRGR
jgi:iron(III) transport system substrate-binding protein